MSKKYDGWTIKNKWGEYSIYHLHETRTEVVKSFDKLMLAERDPQWKWKNYRRRKAYSDNKIVKVKLAEVENE